MEPATRSGALRLGRWSSIGAELVLVALGAVFLTTDEGDLSLLLWCGLATLYSAATLVVLGVSTLRPPLTAAPVSRGVGGRIEYLVSVVSTLLASLVGVTAALQVILLRLSTGAPSSGRVGYEWLGAWAMLLSWSLLHWGFTQAYRYIYYVRPQRPLVFPGTEFPKMVDFAYFGFTIGTSFAVSDVETMGSRIRWVILWQSVVSFFFNGLIIVLALSIITSAGM